MMQNVDWKKLIPYAVLALVATVVAMSIPPAQGFREPTLAKILCFHLPCAILASWYVIASGWFGFQYLRTKRIEMDHRVAASLEIGSILSGLVLSTGIVFSKAQWGDWWQNDPRQTSFLVVCLMLLGGIALRAGTTDDERRARSSAVFSIACQVPFFFLTFVYPRLPAVRKASFHPSNTVESGGIDLWYWIGLLSVGAVVILICRTLFQSRVSLSAQLRGDA